MNVEIELLSNIWRNEIANEYLAGRITTERSLQAALYRFVRNQSPSTDVFVEPIMMYYENDGPRLRPDLVLAESDQISIVCELKFVPHWYPEYESDLDKLVLMANDDIGNLYKLRMAPRTGYFDDNSHHCITTNTWYTLMVVGQADADAVKRDIIESRLENIGNRFTLMYGRISADREPDFGVE